MGWMAAIGLGIQALGAMQKGKGEGGAEQGIGTLALAEAMKHGQTEAMTREKLIEPSQATSEEQRNAYLARMFAAIQNNEGTQGDAIEQVVLALVEDMRTTQGGRIPFDTVPPEQAKIPKTESLRKTVLGSPGVKLTQPEQKEQKPVEPFVPRSLFG